jgi:hypothetical protein
MGSAAQPAVKETAIADDEDAKPELVEA